MDTSLLAKKCLAAMAAFFCVVTILFPSTVQALSATTPVTRISTNSAGAEGNASSPGGLAVSANGRYIVFSSTASNLVAGDTNGVDDFFVKDTVTGSTTRVSTGSAGVEGNGAILQSAAISADGRYVSFSSNATNLVVGDSNGVADMFVKDRQTDVTTRVSTDSFGAQVAGNGRPAMSADGRYVTFELNNAGLVVGDTNGVRDVFLKDTQTGVTARVSTGSAGTQSNGISQFSTITEDGRYVGFQSVATNLVPGDTNGVADFFVKDRQTDTTIRVSTDSSGLEGNALVPGVRPTMSADGRYIAFLSSATNLVPGDTNGVADVFMKDLQTDITTRISSDSSGNQSNGTSAAPTLSADGQFIVFRSDASNLVPGDTNGVNDSFIKDLQTGTIARLSTDSAGTEGNGATSDVSGFSADGRYASFVSAATNLVPNDTNGVADIFFRQNPFWTDPSTPVAPTVPENNGDQLVDTGTNTTAIISTIAGTLILSALLTNFKRKKKYVWGR